MNKKELVQVLNTRLKGSILGLQCEQAIKQSKEDEFIQNMLQQIGDAPIHCKKIFGDSLYNELLLLDAMDKVTIENMEALKNGCEIPLNSTYELYKREYSVIYTIFKTEGWTEIATVLRDGDKITFELIN